MWLGHPRWCSGKVPSYECRRRKRLGFGPWDGMIPWRRSWQPTPVFLPGESHGQSNLVGYSSWDHKESDITEVTEHLSGSQNHKKAGKANSRLTS